MRNKNRENTCQIKNQSHSRNNIYVIRQLAYIHRVAEISLLLGKNTSAIVQFFSLLKTTKTNSNHQNCIFYILHTKFTMGYKMGQKCFPGALPPNPPEVFPWALWPKPPLHGLSLKETPIKNHTTLFESSRVANRIKYN